jgi:hypothetical protein
MIRDPLRPAPNFGVWEVICEYTDMEDNEPIDFTPYTHIQVEIEDPFSGQVVMTRDRNNGVTTPAPGIIIWTANRGEMGGLRRGTYHVRMLAWIDDQNEALPLMDSSVSIVGDVSQ